MPINAADSQPTLSRDQLKRLCNKLLEDAPAILKSRSTDDPAMDKESTLLKALYERLEEKLGKTARRKRITTGGFASYSFSYRTAIYELLESHAKEPFNYRAVINDYIAAVLKRKAKKVG